MNEDIASLNEEVFHMQAERARAAAILPYLFEK